MVKTNRDWCMECAWLSVRVSIEAGSAYWCRSTNSRIDGPVAWRQACDRFERPHGRGAR
ncbi:MAG: hypothetical protein HY925_00235 [Elusimicrobia bacterium]|nr:hypothetical protein [Elusimicrobiota bacterium]